MIGLRPVTSARLNWYSFPGLAILSQLGAGGPASPVGVVIALKHTLGAGPQLIDLLLSISPAGGSYRGINPPSADDTLAAALRWLLRRPGATQAHGRCLRRQLGLRTAPRPEARRYPRRAPQRRQCGAISADRLHRSRLFTLALRNAAWLPSAVLKRSCPWIAAGCSPSGADARPQAGGSGFASPNQRVGPSNRRAAFGSLRRAAPAASAGARSLDVSPVEGSADLVADVGATCDDDTTAIRRRHSPIDIPLDPVSGSRSRFPRARSTAGMRLTGANPRRPRATDRTG
jgi:hypothetical protein